MLEVLLERHCQKVGFRRARSIKQSEEWVVAMLKEFLAPLHPELGRPRWCAHVGVRHRGGLLTAVVLLGYLLKGGQVGWQLWMSVRRIRALTKKGSGRSARMHQSCGGSLRAICGMSTRKYAARIEEGVER